MNNKICEITNTEKPIGWIIVNKIEKTKNNKSKFLNPSFTGNLFTVLEQSSLSISLIPINLPFAPFLYSSINPETVYTLLKLNS